MPLGVIIGCGQAPQFADDEQALTAADALWTAVTAHDKTLLEQCATNLTALRDAGHLSQPAYERFDEIIAQARADNWDKARQRLKKSIKAQKKIDRIIRDG